ncbi:cobalt ECF transporter T component CbiQ [Holophaga foetida]|uniref:cobalt ECF transporter T component CbiQ n=1 Tax=Holophaga foetida TaxID=35839 RepID=UPI0002471CE9|nr:cobalt ECF transporter T component CbiQ [Holophaga foetida]
MDDLAYANRLRRVHPAEKAIFAILCLMASLLARSPIVPLLVLLVMSLVALGVARIPFGAWLRISLLPVGFLLVGGLSLAVDIGTPQGAWSLPLGRGLSLCTTPQGLRLAVHVTARSLGCTAAMLFLAATTPLTDLIQLLRWGRVPDFVIEMLTISYRALFILLETAGQMQRAQASRLGYSSFRTSLRSLGQMVSHLFGRSLQRADLAWNAMLSRGYGEVLCVLPPEYRVSPGRALAGAGVGLGLLLLALFLPGGW